MRRLLSLLLVGILLCSALAFAEETFSVSGEVVYAKDADVYVCLFSQKNMAKLFEGVTTDPLQTNR